MIRVNPTTPSLNTREYFSTKFTKTAAPSLVLSAGSCCVGCTSDLPAIANLTNPTDGITNDKTDFILFVQKGTTTVGTLTNIAPDGTETDYIITDDTYGNFFATGALKPSYWGFLLDWYKVANSLGFGRYKFNVTVTNAASNEIYNEDSPCFILLPYSCDNAHRTVRITTEQKGYFEGGFDYTNLDYNIDGEKKTTWRQEIRLWGRFFRSTRRLETDNIVTKDRGQEQIQAQTVKVFSLLLDTIQPNVSDRLLDDMLLAPEVYLNDYNINNTTVENNERTVLTALGEPVINTLSREEFYNIELEEFYQDNLHRYK